jgi:type II secretion system protein D
MRTNSLIVRASPRDLAEVDLLVDQIDQGSSGVVNQARLFKLQNTLANDLAATLQGAIAAAAGVPGEEKSSVLELLTADVEGQRLVRSGILNDVQITADPHTNTLVVTAPAESMDLLAALIQQLDSPSAVAQIKVFKIVNGDANSLMAMLSTLLPSQEVAGPQLAGAEGEGTLVPVRFSVDVRTNSIIATGSRGDLEIIGALLLRLDEEDVRQRINEVYRLKNSPALDVAAAINEFLRSERVVQQAAPGAMNPFEQIESEVVVVPEPVSNSLILSATPRFFEEVMDLVKDLDKQPPQVMIQVVIAEVELENYDEFGVELGLQDSVLFDRSLLGDLQTITESNVVSTSQGIVTVTQEVIKAATNTPGFAFNNQDLGNSGADSSLASSGIVGGQGLSHFNLGRTSAGHDYGGLVLSASSNSVSVLIRALQHRRRLEVLGRPQVMTLDNQSAFIQVGERVPRIIGSRFDGRVQTNQIELENTGLILGVTPRISPEGMVVMEIDAEKSQVGSEADGIPVSVVEDQVIRSPKIKATTAQTTVSAASGETIILGGLITKDTETIERRIPLVADIPILGHLFRYDGHDFVRRELLIFLTPQVVCDSRDLERIKQAEAARMSWCLSDVHELHGPTGLYEDACGDCWTGPGEVIHPDTNPEGLRPGEFEPEAVSPERLEISPPLQQVPTLADPPLPEPLPNEQARDRHRAADFARGIQPADYYAPQGSGGCPR